jgi:U4/U6 small nuclear ribonucleoprotein PRP3
MKNIKPGGAPPPSLPAKVAAPIPKVPIIPATTPSNVVLSNASPSSSASATPGSGTPLSGSGASDLARRVAEAKRRVAEAQSKLAVKDNPYMTLAASSKSAKKGGSGSASAMGTPVDPVSQQGAGLKMAAHPLLLDQTPVLNQSKKDRYKPMQPKFASIKANVRNAAPTPPPVAPSPASTTPAPGANPYSVGAAMDPGFEGAPRERMGRQMRFNPKGKYVAMANQMRSEQQLEELKQRIAESARKAGLDSEMGIEKNIKVRGFVVCFSA